MKMSSFDRLWSYIPDLAHDHGVMLPILVQKTGRK